MHKKGPGLLLLTGGVGKQSSGRPGKQSYVCRGISGPGQQLLRGNRLKKYEGNEKNVEKKAKKPTELYLSVWIGVTAWLTDLETVSPGGQIPRSFSDSLTQQRHF